MIKKLKIHLAALIELLNKPIFEGDTIAAKVFLSAMVPFK